MKTLLTLILCSLISLSAYAHPKNPNHHLTKMSEILDLNEQQASQSKIIFKEAHHQHKKLREEHIKKRGMIENNTREKLSKILTTEQLKKLDTIYEKRHEAHKDRLNKRKDKPRG